MLDIVCGIEDTCPYCGEDMSQESFEKRLHSNCGKPACDKAEDAEINLKLRESLARGWVL